MDLIYVRCPPRLVELALHTEPAARLLVAGAAPVPLDADESIEAIDLGRAQRYLHRILGPDDEVRPSWVELALHGEYVLPFGCDPAIYGYATYLTSSTVQQLAAHLRAIGDGDFRARYERLVSATGRLRPDLHDDCFDDFVLPRFGELRTFYASAADRAQAVVITPT